MDEEKRASHRKLSEILKSVPAGPFSRETLPHLENSEPSIPTELLNAMGSKDIRSGLATPAFMGIVLKPGEFQRIVLVSIGEKPLADDLESGKKVFGPTDEIDDSLSVDPSCMDEGIKKLLMSLLPDRSATTPALNARAARTANAAPQQSRNRSRKKLLHYSKSFLQHTTATEEISSRRHLRSRITWSPTPSSAPRLSVEHGTSLRRRGWQDRKRECLWSRVTRISAWGSLSGSGIPFCL